MKQFRLSEGDLGRPLADVAENFRFPTFIDNIKHVIATGEILEKEIQTTDLRWCQMNILPYITRADKLNNGVYYFQDRRSLGTGKISYRT